MYIVVAIVTFEVIARRLFNSPTIWVHELSQMVFGTYIMLAGGYILLLNRHVSVDVFTSRLSARVSSIVSVSTSFLFFAYCGVILYHGWDIAWPSFLAREYTGSVWAPPKWPLSMMIPTGAFLILLQGTAKLVRDILTIISGVRYEH